MSFIPPISIGETISNGLLCHCGECMIEMKKNKEEEKEIKSNGCQQEGTEQGRTE